MRLLARTEATCSGSYILLFDEPGTALHPAGQVNLQRVFERLCQSNQIIYSTHSPFMVSMNRPERSRVISKTHNGTVVDQKPYVGNWRAVRDQLGLILSGNFFIASTTLLVEGESDAMYVGALLSMFDRMGVIDADLNLFSVRWVGNSRDFEPMARLLVEEGRHVVVLVDGDGGGKDIKDRILNLNQLITDKRVLAPELIEIVQLSPAQSIEDVLPWQERYIAAVVDVAQELVTNGYRQFVSDAEINCERLLQELEGRSTKETLGKTIETISKKWFVSKQPVSKLQVARTYCSALSTPAIDSTQIVSCPSALIELAKLLRLSSKFSKDTVLAIQEQ